MFLLLPPLPLSLHLCGETQNKTTFLIYFLYLPNVTSLYSPALK
uniref:Uncharacterized protein n=1 Tax=Brassica oleracea TaxID=3712 RepID=A0A3P6F0W8_BRAOL|nr:unnamed protein product [Brassica oleracea]